jgi:hypothetical protein
MCAQIYFVELKYSQLKINHLNDTLSTKAVGGGIYSGVFNKDVHKVELVGTSSSNIYFKLASSKIKDDSS